MGRGRAKGRKNRGKKRMKTGSLEVAGDKYLVKFYIISKIYIFFRILF